jgi:hypothetical protein
MRKFLLTFFAVSLWCYTVGYTSEGHFIHRDQFYSLDINDLKKNPSPFYSGVQEFNEKWSKDIRKHKIANKKENRNILVASLYVFYDDKYQDIEVKEIDKIFFSGWLPTEKDDERAFCLGSAYKNYPLFKDSTDIFKLKKTLTKPLSNIIETKLPSFKYGGLYTDTFIYKLIQDFGMRSIDFEFSGSDSSSVYNHQNHAHTEQAFFSYIEHSLPKEKAFLRKDVPKSVLVNMVSYLPICDTGFCLTAINSLISPESNVFKKTFLKKIMPNFYELYNQEFESMREKRDQNKIKCKDIYDQQCLLETNRVIAETEMDDREQNKLIYKQEYDEWCKKEDEAYQLNYNVLSKLIDDIHINVLFTSSNLPSVNNLDFINQNQMLFKAYN